MIVKRFEQLNELGKRYINALIIIIVISILLVTQLGHLTAINNRQGKLGKKGSNSDKLIMLFLKVGHFSIFRCLFTIATQYSTGLFVSLLCLKSKDAHGVLVTAIAGTTTSLTCKA